MKRRYGAGGAASTAAILATLTALTSGEARAQSRNDDSIMARRALLRDYFEPHRERAATVRYLPGILGAVGLGMGVGAIAADYGEDPAGRSRWVYAGTGGIVLATSVGAYALHEDFRLSALDGALGLLIMGTGAALYVSGHSTPTIRYSTAVMMGTGFVYGGLVVTDVAVSRPIASSTLAGHAERLDRGGDQATERELARMERDFARTNRPIPRWVYSLTLAVGGVGAAAPIFFKSTSEDDKTTSLIIGGMLYFPSLMSIGYLDTNARNSYGSYERALRNVRLAPLGPEGSAGATLSGQF